MGNELKGTEVITTYDTALGTVTLTPETVRKYLVRGNGAFTDQEIALFINLCMYQRLNPWTGEAYLIKFGSDCQIVVGYEKYKNRADDNPNYIGRSQGIVVQRGAEIVKKEGECLYPGEKLLGGWCQVNYMRGNNACTAYKEPMLQEYDKQQANWKSKPCMMIVKVAVSQALRDAFPSDYEGLHTAEEMQSIPAEFEDITDRPGAEVVVEDLPATKEEKQELLKLANEKYGEKARLKLQKLKDDYGIASLDKSTQMQCGILKQAVLDDDYKPEKAEAKTPLETAAS